MRGFCSLLVFTVAISLSVDAHGQDQRGDPRAVGTKAAWAWSEAERLEARCDMTLAAARLSASQRDANLRQQSAGSTPDANAGRAPVVDIIDGRRHPELLMPTELFEWTVSRGLIDGWADYGERAKASGLPPDFWVQLKPIVTLLASDLQERNQALYSTANTPSMKTAPLSITLCRDRADALTKARSVFGPALDRFMYEYVAPSLTKFLDAVSTPGSLKSQEHGCR